MWDQVAQSSSEEDASLPTKIVLGEGMRRLGNCFRDEVLRLRIPALFLLQLQQRLRAAGEPCILLIDGGFFATGWWWGWGINGSLLSMRPLLQSLNLRTEKKFRGPVEREMEALFQRFQRSPLSSCRQFPDFCLPKALSIGLILPSTTPGVRYGGRYGSARRPSKMTFMPA